VHIDKPYVIEEDRTIRHIYPAEARLRNDTYDAPLSIDITTILTIAGVVKETKKIDKYIIGHIPIMVQSSKCNLYNLSKKEKIKHGECPHDQGGYFIIRGKERVLVTQERAAYNMIGVHKQKPQCKYSYISQVRSMSDTTGHSVLIQAKLGKNNKNICFSLPYIQQEIPVGIIFIALGFKLSDIKYLIGITKNTRKFHKTIIEESGGINQQDALKHIGKYAMHVIQQDKRDAYASQILENEIFPHMGVITHSLERGMFLGTLVKKLLETVCGERPCDDRDNIANKRFEVAGILISSLFRSLFKRLVRSVTPLVQKRPDICIALSRFNSITQGFISCFSTGKWGVQKNSYVRQGVSQVLSRLTLGSFRSHLRRIVIPIGKEGKNTQIRQLHGSQIFFICLFETPEGHSSGIVKNFSLTCEVTNGITSSLIREIIEQSKYLQTLEEINDIKIIENATRIYLNGNIIGITKNINEILEELRYLRDINQIFREISISYDDIDNELHIASDSGRLIRPLFSLKNNKIPNFNSDLSWNDMVDNCIIKYRDAAELENMVVAMELSNLNSNIKYDLCEIHPCLMMGVCASIIPFPDHSQSPRNCYQSAMGKQALGLYALSNEARSDTIVHMLTSAQKPLTTTKIASFLGFDNLPSGQNVMVAILTYTGYNQEDSIMMSQGAIDRGLFRVLTYKTVSYIEKKKSSAYTENVQIPSSEVRKVFYKYDKLGDDGIVKVGQKVSKNDVLIGRTLIFTNKAGKTEEKDCSVVAKANESGIIDKVFTGNTPEGFKFIKIKIRSVRIPQVGDKFATRAAQKGTIGAIYRTEDLPFTKDGIVPDIILNPHCIPSRMTINQLIESLGSLLTTRNGKRRDATSFTSHSTGIVNKIQEELVKCGLNPNGYCKMRNGFTGDEIDAQIFMGPTYYQRLKHMVDDKLHARAHGDNQVLTRQPLEGRARDGGLRFGEMERDCMLSHGSSSFLKERLLDMSDYFEVFVCNKCHQISRADNCMCGGNELTVVQIPYACKLLFHELQAMCLKINLHTD
jgi:DNA-directed RNA polymerase II subunit RPB2